MKTLKILLGILAVLVIAILIMAAIAPTSTTVQRSITINAPSEIVMEEVNSLEQMQNWSPWAEMDPNMIVSYEGNLGSVGSVSKWKGNKDVGSGEQTITNITENRIETQLKFYEPWESTADAFIQLNPEGDATQVTWSFTSPAPFPWNAMMLFMNMDEMLGKDFEKGLNKLKVLAEAKAAQEPTYEIEIVEMPQRVYIAKKDSIKWTEISDFHATYLPQIYENAGKQNLKPAGAATGIYYVWDEENQMTVMAAAIPVMGDEKTKVKGYETIVMPSGRNLKLVYFGSYDGSEKAHLAMDQYIKENSMQQTGPVVEEYVTDPTMEKDTSKWQTIIYYPIQ
ncbi:MAG: SRPBCC family protein [Bacteroidia bacterium]